MTEAKKFFRGVLRFSWSKCIIWSLFLLLTYILRHFFFIIFMTFLIAYLMSNLLDVLTQKVFRTRSRIARKILTIICFITLLCTTYGVGKFFIPKIAQQGQSLIRKVGTLEDSPKRSIDSLLRATVGQWLFEQQFGAEGDPEFEQGYAEYVKHPLLSKEYAEFLKLSERINILVEREYNRNLKKQTGSAADDDAKVLSFKKFKETNPAEYQDLVQEVFTKEFHGENKTPYDWPLFKELSLESEKGIEAFSERYTASRLQRLPSAAQTQILQANFAFEQSSALVDTWKDGAVAERLGDEVERRLLALFGTFGNYLASLVPALLTLPIQLVLSLMLSFFITYDLERLSSGAERLRKNNRVGHIYAEIVPGLRTFASLIGRAFQAQGCIAIVNAVLTWLLIKFLGIENALFLAALVFLSSFIPVLGVVISSIPIAAMAIVQDGGSFGLALWSIAGVLVVHFIETSLLNPKIVGTFLHLHPVLVLVILALGEHFFGAWGLLLGLPVAVYIIRIVILDEGLPWQKIQQ